jgi:hypothetical protein
MIWSFTELWPPHRPREIGQTWLWAKLEKIARFKIQENSSLQFQNDLAFLGRIGKPSLSEFPEIYGLLNILSKVLFHLSFKRTEEKQVCSIPGEKEVARRHFPFPLICLNLSSLVPTFSIASNLICRWKGRSEHIPQRGLFCGHVSFFRWVGGWERLSL